VTGAFSRGEPARPPFRVLHRDVPASSSGHRMPRPRSGPVITIRVVPAVWRAALRLAGGDARRLQVVDAGTVLVHNHGR
jgi:hypothetical protein